jgi:hypothetical protein
MISKGRFVQGFRAACWLRVLGCREKTLSVSPCLHIFPFFDHAVRTYLLHLHGHGQLSWYKNILLLSNPCTISLLKAHNGLHKEDDPFCTSSEKFPTEKNEGKKYIPKNKPIDTQFPTSFDGRISR